MEHISIVGEKEKEKEKPKKHFKCQKKFYG